MTDNLLLDELYNQRGGLLDTEYAICQELIARQGFYIEADLPISKSIHDLTEQIEILETLEWVGDGRLAIGDPRGPEWDFEANAGDALEALANNEDAGDVIRERKAGGQL